MLESQGGKGAFQEVHTHGTLKHRAIGVDENVGTADFLNVANEGLGLVLPWSLVCG